MKLPNLQPLRRQLSGSFIFGILAVALLAGASCYRLSTFGYGGLGLYTLVVFAVGFPILAAPVVGGVGVLLWLLSFKIPATRRWGISFLLCSAVFFLTTTLSIPALRSTVQKLQTASLSGLAQRSEPLVAAITKYAEDNGVPPVRLTDLVPGYLPVVPGTGLPAYPDYEYSTESERWNGNPWALYVETPSGMINWDMFIYLPLQNYPTEGYGGWLQRVGDWAYVHE